MDKSVLLFFFFLYITCLVFKLALRRHETSTAVPSRSLACSDTCCYRQSITDNFGFVASVLISNFQMRATCVKVNYIRCVTTIRGYTLSSSPLDIFSRASRKLIVSFKAPTSLSS